MEISAIKCHKCGKYRLTSTLCACEWKAAIDEANAENVKLRMQDIETIRLLRAEVRAWRSGFDAMKDVKTNLTVLVDGRHVPIAIGEALSFRAGITARSATDAAGAMGERR